MTLNTTEQAPLATGHGSTGRAREKRTAEVRETVLVVEDDPAHRELLVEMLSLWGYDPVPVGSAEEAEYVARKKLLDAAIVDVFLPGKSGTTVMTKLREKFPDL